MWGGRKAGKCSYFLRILFMKYVKSIVFVLVKKIGKQKMPFEHLWKSKITT